MNVRHGSSHTVGHPFVLAGLLLCLLVVACGSIKRCAYSGFRRDAWQQPDRVVESLGLAGGARVADLGAGGGYFTFRLAAAVGDSGRVYAVDVDDDMIRYLEERARDEGASNVTVVKAASDDPGLPEPVDLVFTSNTYHHLPDRVPYLEGLRAHLRPGGRLAIVEFREGNHGTPPETIDAELDAAGYTLRTAHDFLEKQSFRIYTPKASP